MLAVGATVIDLTPDPDEGVGDPHFGSADKTILVGSVLAGVVVLAAVAGLLARRRFTRYGAEPARRACRCRRRRGPDPTGGIAPSTWGRVWSALSPSVAVVAHWRGVARDAPGPTLEPPGGRRGVLIAGRRASAPPPSSEAWAAS